MLPIYTDEQKATLLSWPKGTYDPRFNFDGKSTPLTLPPAHGLAQVDNETYTAEGPISYWNAYVAVTQMHGRGNFSDPRLGVNIVQEPDLVTPKLAALRAYQHSLPGRYVRCVLRSRSCGNIRRTSTMAAPNRSTLQGDLRDGTDMGWHALGALNLGSIMLPLGLRFEGRTTGFRPAMRRRPR